ncbi:hypothetical protein ACWGBV_15555 [Streptomyces sp. NPDC055051]
MPDIAAATAALTATAAAAQQGPGDTLRIVLLVSMVGGALLAWFLLRGYGGGTPDDATGESAGKATGETSDGTTAEAAAGTAGRPAGAAARGASGDAGDANA